MYWKPTAIMHPKDGEDCLVYNPCDGYRIAEWDADDACFYEHACRIPVSPALAEFWIELPSHESMSLISRGLSSSLVMVEQAT